MARLSLVVMMSRTISFAGGNSGGEVYINTYVSARQPLRGQPCSIEDRIYVYNPVQ